MKFPSENAIQYQAGVKLKENHLTLATAGTKSINKGSVDKISL